MNLSEKQFFILSMFDSKPEITKKEVCKCLGKCYYHNSEKYLGEILSRMVHNGMIKRIRPGVFVRGKMNFLSKKHIDFKDPQQQNLF